MITLKANLSPLSLTNLSKDLMKYYDGFMKAKAEILETLSEYAYSRIMLYVPVRTGTLQQSIHKEIADNWAKIYTDLYYAKYVEFGTGVRGINSNYDPQYNLTYNEQYLHGQVAQKFMYRAKQDVEANYVSIVNNILKRRGLI